MYQLTPSRRDLLKTAAASVALTTLASARASASSPPKLGIANTSFAGAFSSQSDSLAFLERCHGFGAAGIQTHMNGDLAKLRTRAEQLGMWMEAMFPVRNQSPEKIERSILDAKAAGCSVARDAMLVGRRYETFHSLDEWTQWRALSIRSIEAALPLLEKNKFTLAIENHKDWTAEEFAALLKKYSSEYLGACVDYGNNISLLDDPMDLIEAAAPYVKSTHVKDIAVQSYADGFEMSEVPLGTGVLDVPSITSLLLQHNPNLHLSLEMITRDPLKIPCLNDQYWITFPQRSGRYLAHTLRMVDAHHAKQPLPVITTLDPAARKQQEDENIRSCFRYSLTTA
jgi:sugar phosphate isomerase/epimerase